MLLNKRKLEKLKEDWWKNEEYQAKCEKAEDQADGISIQNIGGVFIVIFVGIGMACLTLVFEYWWYKYRKNTKIVQVAEAPQTATGAVKHHHHNEPTNVKMAGMFGAGEKSEGDGNKGWTNTNLRTRNQSFGVNLKSKF